MDGRFLLQDETKINYSYQRHEKMEARPSNNSCSCSLSKDQDSNCYCKAVEYSCSACLFCVSCPLCIVWCCIKLPCKIGWKAAKHACSHYWSCCGSKKKVYESYSSFSDIESDNLPTRVGKRDSSSGSSKNRMKVSSNELQCRRRSSAS